MDTDREQVPCVVVAVLKFFSYFETTAGTSQMKERKWLFDYIDLFT